MKTSYGKAFCQSLKARPLDDLIARLFLEAMMPTAIEASLAIAETLEAEHATIYRHWRERLERAGYEPDFDVARYLVCRQLATARAGARSTR